MSDLLLPESARQGVETEQVGQQDRRTPGVIVQPMPCTIHFKSGEHFVVPEVEGWGYVDVGVFATGHFTSSPNAERNILIPYDNIKFYDLDYDALERFIVARAQEEEANERDSGSGPVADEGQPEEAS